MSRRPSGNVSRRGCSLRPKQTSGGAGAQPGQRQVAGIQISGTSLRTAGRIQSRFHFLCGQKSGAPVQPEREPGMWSRNREQEQERVLVLVLAQWLRPGGRAGWSLTCKTQLWSRLWAGAPSRLGKSSCDPTCGTAVVEFQTGSLTSPSGTTGVNVPPDHRAAADSTRLPSATGFASPEPDE